MKNALAKEQMRLTTEIHKLQNATNADAFLEKQFVVGKEMALVRYNM